MEERQFSLSEVAELLNISERTARRWIKAGKLRAYKPGRDYRIPEHALRQLAQESEVHPKVKASLSQDRLFDGVREREAFIQRVRENANSFLADYEKRLAEAEGYEATSMLFNNAYDEWTRFVDLVNGELAERWLLDPEVLEHVKESLSRTVGEVMMRPMADLVGRIATRVKELAETEEQKAEVERRRQLIRELTKEIA
jgi:excisionase family DNA binding protein